MNILMMILQAIQMMKIKLKHQIVYNKNYRFKSKNNNNNNRNPLMSGKRERIIINPNWIMFKKSKNIISEQIFVEKTMIILIHLLTDWFLIIIYSK